MRFPVLPTTTVVGRSRASAAAPGVFRVARMLLAGLLVAHPLDGAVAWGSHAYHENSDSRGSSWGPEFRMSLGVFAEGFEPTGENLGQWSAHWLELDLAAHDPDERRFAGLVDRPVPLPDGWSGQVHVWVRNRDRAEPGAEWLLFTRPDWRWPAAAGVTTPVATWIIDAAAEPVVGTVGQDGASLATVAVGPAPEPLAEWLAERFPAGGSAALADADPDGDGMSNRLEYFLGTDPTRPDGSGAPEIASVTGGLRLSLARNPAVPSVFAVEASGDLVEWHAAPHQVIENRPDLIVIDVPTTVGRSFFRIRLGDPPGP